jgi:ATP-dependent exoDNAse (exonuclease V) alpha subunit
LVKVTYNDQGDQILVRINKYVPPPINFYQIILIDEGSMVNDETAKELIGYVKEGNKALIVLGDYCQLPPVNQETDSLFFENISSYHTNAISRSAVLSRKLNKNRNHKNAFWASSFVKYH